MPDGFAGTSPCDCRSVAGSYPLYGAPSALPVKPPSPLSCSFIVRSSREVGRTSLWAACRPKQWIRPEGARWGGQSAPPGTGPLPLALGELLGELRRDREQVTDHAEVGELEDRRFGVLVDGDDRLGRLHAGPVLDGPGDADRDVELRRHGDPGLADLHLVRHPSGVGGRA